MRAKDEVLRVGIPWAKLRAHAPRGVVRVARAVTERLVASPKFEMYAISDPVFESNELLCEAAPLAEWLDRHPMRIPMPPVLGPIPIATPAPPALPPARVPPLARVQWACAVVLSELGLRRLLLPAWRRRLWVKRAIRKACRMLGLARPARAVWHALRGKPTPPPVALPAPVIELPPPLAVEVPPPPNEYISIRDLDVIVSFECFDAIWEWPVELFQTKLIGLYYDAIPFRIDEGENWDPGRYMRALGRMVARAHSIGCISQSALNDLASFFPSTRGRSWLWYLSADEERFLPASITTPTEAHPITQRPGRKIAMIGEIEPRKNQAGVFRACRLLGATDPDERLTLVLIGRKPARNPYQMLADEAGRFVDVVYTDYVPDEQIGDVLRACDVFVYPSLWEGFGIPVLEAMLAGVPVVCADLSSLPEVAGEHAFYCDPFDPESIAAAIRSALELEPDARAALVQNAREWVSRFSWDATAELLADAIVRVAGESTQPVRRAG